jgi:hypothetical protein
MNFNQLAWGAVCFYYRSIGDSKYNRIMSDTDFVTRLRNEPFNVSSIEFEEKVLLDHVNVENYDLLIGHGLSSKILSVLVQLLPEIMNLKKLSLLDCDLSDDDTTNRIKKIYAAVYAVNGLWLTGVSKIVHLLNDGLFPLLNLNISKQFGILEGDTSLIQWMKITQQNAREVTEDFNGQGLTGCPGEFLSEKLGYSRYGYQKSLIKFLDEFFWLRFGDNLAVPPNWIPPAVDLDE